MPTKKKVAKKSAQKKTFLEKVGNKASHLKDEIVAGTDHVVEFAGEAFESIKEGVKHLIEKKKPKKTAKKAAPKKAVKKKAIKKVAVKKATVKPAPKKTIKKTAKKTAR
jgi:adenylate kinase